MIQGGHGSGFFAPCDDGGGFGSGGDISLFGNGFGAVGSDGDSSDDNNSDDSHYCSSRFGN